VLSANFFSIPINFFASRLPGSRQIVMRVRAAPAGFALRALDPSAWPSHRKNLPSVGFCPPPPNHSPARGDGVKTFSPACSFCQPPIVKMQDVPHRFI